MKTTLSLSAFSFALLTSAHFSPLAAQYNPPPPPDQANTGESFQQGQVPPPDQGDDSVPPPDAQGDQGGDANFQTFYDNLSSQGNWVQTDNYGYVFQPNEDDPDWAPYTNGHWVYTDEGWTWLADESEPFGWATYHYGRWANLDGYGWVWVPGYTWAPAWVSWRYGNGYCGWAPLPPETFVGVDVEGVSAGFDFHIGGDCDRAYDIGPRYYNFIQVGYLGSRNYRHHFADRNNNFVIINNTRNVTNIVVNNRGGGSGRFGRVSTGGPDIATVDAQSSNRIQRVQLTRSNRVGNANLNGNQLAVFAPRVNRANAGNFRPSRVADNVANARINSGASISQPLQVTRRVRQNAASSAQVSAAQNVHFSEGSRVATPDVQSAHKFNRPLTSFAPQNGAATSANAPSNRAAKNASVQPNGNVNASANTGRTEANPGSQSQERHHDHANASANGQQNLATPQTQTHVQAQNQVQAQQEGQAAPTHHHEVRAEQSGPQAGQQSEVRMQQNRHEESQAQTQPRAEVQHLQSQPVEHHEQQHQESHAQAPQHQTAAPQQQHQKESGGGKGNDRKDQH